VSRRECLRGDRDYCVVGDWGLVRTTIMAEINWNRVRVASTHDARIEERERPGDVSVRDCEEAYDEEERHGEIIIRLVLWRDGMRSVSQRSFARAVAANVDEFCPARASDLVRRRLLGQ
jgi:hypothetical protein